MIEAIRQNGSSSYWSKLERGEVLPSEFEAGFAKELEEVAGQECKTVGKWLSLSTSNYPCDYIFSKSLPKNLYPKPLHKTVTQNRYPNPLPKPDTKTCH